MFAVWTITGMAMTIGRAVLDPQIPTLFEELPDAVKFQGVNLRIEEVSGPDAPTIAGRPYRDADGETISPDGVQEDEEALEPDDLVPADVHIAVVEERNELRTRNDELNRNLTQSSAALDGASNSIQELETQLTTLEGERDDLQAKLAEATQKVESYDQTVQERDALKTEVDRLQTAAPDLEAIEVLLPNSESEIKGLSLPKLKALAAYRGKEVTGEDKAPYIAALLQGA